MSLDKSRRGYPKQSDRITELNVAAGDAADGALSYYVDVTDCDGMGYQLEWTAGAGGGTIEVTVFGSNGDAGDEKQASALDYQDIGAIYQGSATITDDHNVSDSACVAGQYAWLKFTVTVADKANDTTYYLKYNKTYRGV